MFMPRHTPDIAVVGAGAAGLACAERLAERGLQVQVYDQGRRPGGRVAHRNRAGVDFEYGAPGRGEVIERLGRRVHVAGDCRITELHRTPTGAWQLAAHGQPLRSLHAEVVLALPPAEALNLLGPAPRFAAALKSVRMRPALVALVVVPVPLGGGAHRLRFRDDSLAAVHRQQPLSPHQEHIGEGWVLHATREFSRDNLNCDPNTVATHLWQRFRRHLGLSGEGPAYLRGHRWPFARTEQALGQACLHDATLGLGVCGDWCLGDTVDDALASGRALAARMLGRLETPPRRTFAVKKGTA